GHRFASLVTNEVFLILHGVETRSMASAAARVRFDRVLDVTAAVREVSVIGAIREIRAAARCRASVRRVRSDWDEDLVDRAVVETRAPENHHHLRLQKDRRAGVIDEVCAPAAARSCPPLRAELMVIRFRRVLSKSTTDNEQSYSKNDGSFHQRPFSSQN